MTWVLLLTLGISWGLSFSLLKLAAGGFSPVAIVGLCSIAGAAALIAVCRSRGALPKFGRTEVMFYAVCALLSSIGPFLLGARVAPHLPASVLTLILSMPPIFTYAFALIARLERVTARRLAGLGLGVVSVLLVLVPQASLPVETERLWIVIALGSPLMYGAYHVFAARFWPEGSSALQVSAGSMLVGTLVMVPSAFLLGGLGPDLLAQGWAAAHWGLAGLVVLTPLDAWLFFEIIRRAGPVVATQSNFISVVSGVFFAMALFGEQPSGMIWISAGILVCALALTLKPPRAEA